MKEVKKTYYAIEVHELEKGVSEFFERDVKVSEMKVCVDDCIHYNCISVSIEIDGSEDVFDLGTEYEYRKVEWPADLYLEEKYIFAFDTKLFKSYVRAECHDS